MAGERIRELRLFVLKEQADALLQEMILSGGVEFLSPEAAVANVLSPENGAEDAQRAERDRLQRALEILAVHAPEKPRLFSSKIQIWTASFLDFRPLAAAQLRAERIVDLDARLRVAAAEQERIQKRMAELQPWSAWAVPLDCAGTAQCCVLFGTAPASARFAALQKSLRAVTAAAELTLVSKDRTRQYLELICFRSMREQCTAALQKFGFCEMDVAVTGTAAEALAAEQAALEQVMRTQETLRTELAAMAVFRPELQLGFDRLTLRIAAETVKASLCATAQTVHLRAAATSQNAAMLEAMFERFGCAWEWSDPDPAFRRRIQPPAFALRYTEISSEI